MFDEWTVPLTIYVFSPHQRPKSTLTQPLQKGSSKLCLQGEGEIAYYFFFFFFFLFRIILGKYTIFYKPPPPSSHTYKGNIKIVRKQILKWLVGKTEKKYPVVVVPQVDATFPKGLSISALTPNSDTVQIICFNKKNFFRICTLFRSAGGGVGVFIIILRTTRIFRHF